MIIQNTSQHLGGKTALYLILEKAKHPINLIILMIVITYCMNHWDREVALFFVDKSIVLHYLAVSLYAVLKYGWFLSSALFVCFGFAGFLEYISTRFTVTDTALTVSTGEINRREIVIPFSQVETINISSTPGLRLLGLSTFVVKTSAQNGVDVSKDDSEPDAVLPVISTSLAKELQDHILSISSKRTV